MEQLHLTGFLTQRSGENRILKRPNKTLEKHIQVENKINNKHSQLNKTSINI